MDSSYLPNYFFILCRSVHQCLLRGRIPLYATFSSPGMAKKLFHAPPLQATSKRRRDIIHHYPCTTDILKTHTCAKITPKNKGSSGGFSLLSCILLCNLHVHGGRWSKQLLLLEITWRRRNDKKCPASNQGPPARARVLL